MKIGNDDFSTLSLLELMHQNLISSWIRRKEEFIQVRIYDNIVTLTGYLKETKEAKGIDMIAYIFDNQVQPLT